jgi:hypothetical protein
MAKHLHVGLARSGDSWWPVRLIDDERPDREPRHLSVDSFASLAALCKEHDATARITGDVIAQMVEAGVPPRIV